MIISSLYKKDVYLNKDIPYLYCTHIYEYDMHHAGISIVKEFGLLPENEILKILKKSKNKKDIAVLLGLIQKKDGDFKIKLSKGFEEIRKQFFESNEIEDNQILSIKKDAIFTLRPCENLAFGEVKFIKKHIYTSFIHTDAYEFYYNNDELDVKGLDDRLIYFHKDYMIDLIRKFIYKIENESKESAIRFMRVMIDRYKRRELNTGYYRTFDRQNGYPVIDSDVVYNEITCLLLPNIRIDVNYKLLLQLLMTVL